jgi:hypothetical protein
MDPEAERLDNGKGKGFNRGWVVNNKILNKLRRERP